MHQDNIQVVNAGGGTVTGMFISEYENTWEMTSVLPDGVVKKRGLWHDKLTMASRLGKQIIRREQKIIYADKTDYQLDEVYRENLIPVHIQVHSANEPPHTDIYYDDNKMWGRKIMRIADGKEIKQLSMPFSFELPHSVFDWHLWGILIAGFPLKENYSAKFLAHESYSYLPGNFRWISFTVINTAIINAGKWGRAECWLVEVQAEVKWKIWIAKDKTIAPVQQICIDYLDESELWWKPFQTNNVS